MKENKKKTNKKEMNEARGQKLIKSWYYYRKINEKLYNLYMEIIFFFISKRKMLR